MALKWPPHVKGIPLTFFTPIRETLSPLPQRKWEMMAAKWHRRIGFQEFGLGHIVQ